VTDGRTILKSAQDQIRHASASIDVLSRDERTPIEYRQSVRREQLLAARQTFEAARRDLTAWAAQERADAQRRLNAKPVSDAATESRRVAQELRIGRLIDAAKAGNNPRTAARDLADRAVQAYGKGDADEALVLARAASELQPGERTAAEVLGNLEADEILASPARARALREIQDIDVVMAAAERDLSAAMAEALVQSSRAARDLGEHREVGVNLQAAAEASVRAKFAAFADSQLTGTPYQEPATGVSSIPTHDGRSVESAQ
jgi:hypothetical protein